MSSVLYQDSTKTFLDDPESNYDEYEVLGTLDDVDFDGVLSPDLVPLVEGETEWMFGGSTARAVTVGYIKGMLRSLQ